MSDDRVKSAHTLVTRQGPPFCFCNMIAKNGPRGINSCWWAGSTIRETSEGWPLLTEVKTEVNGDLKSANKRNSFLVGSWGCQAGTRCLFLWLSCSSRPNTNIFFPHGTLFQFLCAHQGHWSPSPSKLARQPYWVAYLLLCISERKSWSADQNKIEN